MKRVLFVDDEQRVLDGLRRMLYSLRSEWRMDFVTSGREALEVLSSADCDVLITDLRMPGMSGLELLAEVVKNHPNVVRLVLSGTADQEVTIRSTSLAHQYLLKPCDAATLRMTVGRAFSLRVMLGDPKLKQLISAVHCLPSVPAVYAKLMEVLQMPDAGPKEIGQVIALDVSMTAKVLQLVNSAFFGIRRQVTNPTEAAVYLGTDTVRELVLVASVFSAFKVSGSSRFSIETLQEHSLTVAALARDIALAVKLSKDNVDQAHAGGLLHAVGKLVWASRYPKEYDEVLQRAGETSTPEMIAELEAFGTTHAEVGAYLLWLWGLPDSVTEIVLRHHEYPLDVVDAPTPAGIVYLADAMTRTGVEQERATQCLTALGLGGRLEGWMQTYVSNREPQVC